MNPPDDFTQLVLSMKYNPVRDYVIPGLTSSLIGAGKGKGQVRLFSQARMHEEPITPHSHRFDFTCLVLKGHVTQCLWGEVCSVLHPNADPYRIKKLVHRGKFGEYDQEDGETLLFERSARNYGVNEWYSMKAEEIHSIFFSKGAEVLFFEGPNRLDHSYVLEPISDGRVIPTFRVDPWMFREETA
jgi:hypothetical protein